MDAVDGFMLAITRAIFWFCGCFTGFKYGAEMSVDKTKLVGYFIAYGKKRKAVEAPGERGDV